MRTEEEVYESVLFQLLVHSKTHRVIGLGFCREMWLCVSALWDLPSQACFPKKVQEGPSEKHSLGSLLLQSATSSGRLIPSPQLLRAFRVGGVFEPVTRASPLNPYTPKPLQPLNPTNPKPLNP